jgi:DNA polymerase
MENHPAFLEALAAIRARLALDLGLGVEFIGETVDWERIDHALQQSGEPRRNPTSLVIRPDDAPPTRPRGPKNESPPTMRQSRSTATEAEVSSKLESPQPVSRPSLVPFVQPPINSEKEVLLADLQEEAGHCRNCELCERRNAVVWGEGSLDSPVMFIGEGPGRDEDLEGRPFVGRSGRLLTDIIEKGMKVPRREVYIANVVKCRPPGNRDPKPEEVAACSRYLNRQIEVIKPRIIVAVGGVAGCALLGLPPKTSGLRGRWHSHLDIPVRVIYHPSYLLRQRRSTSDRTQADRDTWNDIQEVMARL